jgi:hypothetical protein
LYQVTRSHEEHLVAVIDEGMADACDEMGLAYRRRPEGEQVMPLCEPAIGIGQRRSDTEDPHCGHLRLPQVAAT